MNSSLKLAVLVVFIIAVLLTTALVVGAFGSKLEVAGSGASSGPVGIDGPEPVQEVTADVEMEPARLEAAVPTQAPAGEATKAADAGTESPRTNVYGRIVDDAGMPLAGAQLASIFSDGRPRGAGNTAESDRQGRVELTLRDADVRHWKTEVFPMIFAATMEGRASNFVGLSPRWHGTTDLGDIVLVLGGSLTGITVDAWGQAVPGAVLYAAEPVIATDLDALRISGPDTAIVRPRAEAGEDGRFALSGVAPGQTRLWAHAKGHLWTISEPFEVIAGVIRDCGTLVLDEVPVEQRVSGVVRRPDGSPAAGAQVAFDSMALGQEGTLKADSRGQFQLVPKGEGTLRIVARDGAGRYGPSAVALVHRGMEVELQLTVRRVITVLVIDPDGTPIERAAVMPFVIHPEMLGGRGAVPGQDWIHTDAEGQAVVPVLAETFEVSGFKRGYEGQSLGPFEPGSAPIELTLELVPEPRIEGRVLAYGQPVAGMRIIIAQRLRNFVPLEAGFPIRFLSNRSDSVESGADGSFSCAVDESWTDITVLAIGESYAAGETELTVQEGKGAKGVVVEVTEGGVLTGTLLPPPGRNALGYVVAASRGDGFPVWTRADAQGRYRLEKLSPGPWRVEGRDREPAREVLSAANRPEDKLFNWNVHILDRKEVKFDIDMRGLGDIELSGQFTIDGAPASGWMAELVSLRVAIQREAIPAAELDSRGNFTLTARAGRYDLRLLGTLAGDVRVEVLREIHLEGSRQDWDGELTTGTLSEAVEGDHDQVRLVRGSFYEGDREITLVPLEDGHCDARVPVGSSSFQVPAGMTEWGPTWSRIRSVEVR